MDEGDSDASFCHVDDPNDANNMVDVAQLNANISSPVEVQPQKPQFIIIPRRFQRHALWLLAFILFCTLLVPIFIALSNDSWLHDTKKGGGGMAETKEEQGKTPLTIPPVPLSPFQVWLQNTLTSLSHTRHYLDTHKDEYMVKEYLHFERVVLKSLRIIGELTLTFIAWMGRLAADILAQATDLEL